MAESEPRTEPRSEPRTEARTEAAPDAHTHAHTHAHTDARPGTGADGGTWDADGAGVVSLPSGRLIRGRALRRPLPAGGGPEPAYAVYLLGKEPPPVRWEAHWLRWPDFRLPADRAKARAVLMEAWRRAAGERVEIACYGGRGRTGTALACVAVLDGVPPKDAVAYVRRHYDRHAVETPWQRAYVRRFGERG